MKNTSKKQKVEHRFTGIHPIHTTLDDGTDVSFQRGEVYELPTDNTYIQGLIAQGYFTEETKTPKDHA